MWTSEQHAPAREPATRTVVVVNPNPSVLTLLEAVLDEGPYDLSFAQSSGHAYSLIRQTGPDLVVLCATLDDESAFRLLSMLKLDPVTRDVPVVTCADDGDEASGASGRERDDSPVLARPVPAPRVH